jgi:diguanylate cyclase (GGDEF)-like protein
VFLIPTVGVLVLAAVWTGVLSRLGTEKAEVLQAAQAKADVLADALVQHTETTIHDVDVIALVVKREFESNPASVNLKFLQDAGLITRETAAQVSVVDSAGRILQSTIPFAGGVYIADRTHFGVHRKPDVPGIYISTPALGRVSGKRTIQLTRRLETQDGRFAGVVVVSEDRRYLTRGFSKVAALGENGSASVFLDNGEKLSDDVVDESSSRPAQQGADIKRPAQTQIAARRPVPGYPLQVEVKLDRTDALAPYISMRWVYISSTLMLSVFFVIFVTAISILVHRLSKSRDGLRVLSETDALTGLLNRHGLLARVNEVMAKQTCLKRLAIVYIDLGNLKRVNDMLGHEAGDQLLRKIATRVECALVPHTVGRFGGDEFLAIVTTDAVEEDAFSATKKVISALVDIFETAVTLRGNVFSIRASIGIAVHARSEDGVSTLIREADEAMYAAKAQMARTQKTSWCFYSNDMRERGRCAVESEQRFRAALNDGALKLGFHPIRALHDGAVLAFRVTVCIAQEGGGLLLANSYLSATEKNGLLASVTEFAFLQMCVTVKQWQEEDGVDVRLSCQLSNAQFLNIDCAFMIRELAREFAVAPEVFQLEVPESAFRDEPVLASERVAALSSAGVRLMLYEFSGGFSAFELLENSRFAGVVAGRVSCPADIFVSAVERATHSGRMVLLESDQISGKVAHNAMVALIENLDDPLDAEMAIQLLLQMSNP